MNKTRQTVVLSGMILLCVFFFAAPAQAQQADGEHSKLLKALTFHASFDGSVDADYARGDRRIYTAESTNRKEIKQGLKLEGVTIAKGKGRWGDALQFHKNTKQVVLFKAEKNVAYRKEGFNGTVSFWLSLDPDQDLRPGYCDPLQITDKAWNNASFFVDFTKDDKPRHVRLGVFADYKQWNPTDQKWDDIPKNERPMVNVSAPPFAHGRWTHVAFTFANLNTTGGRSVAKFYLDGKFQGEVKEIPQLTWDPQKTAIMLGISYIGLYDDLAIFNRALSQDEILVIGSLEKGISLLRQ